MKANGTDCWFCANHMLLNHSIAPFPPIIDFNGEIQRVNAETFLPNIENWVRYKIFQSHSAL